MYSNSYVVSSLLATFRVPYAPRWEKPLARLPLISLLAAFSLTSVAFLRLFDVNSIGPRVFVDVVLVTILVSIVLNFFAVSYFVLTGAVERSAATTASHPISWRPMELVLLLAVVAALAIKLFFLV